MLRDLIQEYKEVFEGVNFLEDLWFTGNMFLIMFILGLLTVMALAGVVMFLEANIKQRVVAKHGWDSEVVQKRLSYYKTQDIVYKSGKYFIISFIVLICIIVCIALGGKSSIIKLDTLNGLKVEMLDTATTAYIKLAEATPIEIKETLALNTPENMYGLYELSFTSNGEQFKDQIVYITYTEDLPSDTLIPFDGSLYTELVPTDTERNTLALGNISKDAGIRFNAYIDGTSVKRIVYIDDIDYIYNIKVNKKGD